MPRFSLCGCVGEKTNKPTVLPHKRPHSLQIQRGTPNTFCRGPLAGSWTLLWGVPGVPCMGKSCNSLPKPGRPPPPPDAKPGTREALGMIWQVFQVARGVFPCEAAGICRCSPFHTTPRCPGRVGFRTPYIYIYILSRCQGWALEKTREAPDNDKPLVPTTISLWFPPVVGNAGLIMLPRSKSPPKWWVKGKQSHF